MFAFALLAALAAGRASANVSPVEKVVSLLQDLQTELQNEGSDEAATYESFSCFCKSKTNEKVASIDTRESDVSGYTASVTSLTARRAELKQQLKDLHAYKDAAQRALQKATNVRDAEHAQYEVKHTDTTKSLHGLEEAITSVGGTQDSLVQKKVVEQSLALARALNLAQVPPAPDTDYDYHGTDLMKVLDDLKTTFTQRKTDLENEEGAALSAFNLVASGKRAEISTTDNTIDSAETQLADTESDLATAEENNTEEKALLADDNTYLKDLTGQCEAKAREWDQRSTLRKNELVAISQALDIISNTVADKASASGAGGRHAVAAVSGLVQVDAGEQYTDVVLVQKAVRRVEPSSARSRAIVLLKRAAAQTNSPHLALAAMKIAEDPFAKVKTLIQKLIERLASEAADEATQKGWCDTQLGTTRAERDYRHTDASELNANIQVLEARRVRLEETSAELTGEIAALESSYSTASRNRADEKAENKQTLENAQQGVAALKNAIGILQSFYKQAGKAALALVQRASPVDADMGEGIGHLGVYQGKQAEAGGILGMLATIQSDFERTIKETTAAENASHRGFVAFERETKASVKSKETGRRNAENDLQQTRGDLLAALNQLQRTQALLDAALETLEKLRPACIDTGMTYEQRVARREAEIQALKDAVCTLDEEDRTIAECNHPPAFLQKK